MRFGERPAAEAGAARAWCPGRPAVITAVAFPREVGRAFPRRCRQKHVQSPRGTRGAAGSAINSSWGPGLALKWVVSGGNGWMGNKIRLEGSIPEPCSGSDAPLRPLGSGCSLATWAPGYRMTDGREAGWGGVEPTMCCVSTGGKRRKTRRSRRTRRWVLGNRMGQARDMSSESSSQQGQSLVSGKPKYQKDSERGRTFTEAEPDGAGPTHKCPSNLPSPSIPGGAKNRVRSLHSQSRPWLSTKHRLGSP